MSSYQKHTEAATKNPETPLKVLIYYSQKRPTAAARNAEFRKISNLQEVQVELKLWNMQIFVWTEESFKK